MVKRISKLLLEALALCLLACTLALTFHYARGLASTMPLVPRVDYRDLIFVDCPEVETKATSAPLEADLTPVAGRGLVFPERSLVIDASSAEVFTKGHLAGAISIPYDELEGLDPNTVSQLRKGGWARIFVYCDGWEDEADPAARFPEKTPGSMMAEELRSAGLAGVSYLRRARERHVAGGGLLETEATR